LGQGRLEIHPAIAVGRQPIHVPGEDLGMGAHLVVGMDATLRLTRKAVIHEDREHARLAPGSGQQASQAKGDEAIGPHEA